MSSAKNKKTAIIKELGKVGFLNYYLQIFEPDCEIETRIELLLKLSGVAPSFTGYYYVKDAIKLVFKSDNYIKICDLYQSIAIRFEAENMKRVERNIRHVKEKALEAMSPQIKYLIFGDDKVSKMDNGKFIYSLSTFMKSFKI